MKMTSSRYESIKAGIRTVVDHYGLEVVKRRIVETSLMRTMWGLLDKVIFDWMYDDDNPEFKAGRVRILPCRSGKHSLWNMYEGDLERVHYDTAMKRIAKELGLS